MPSVLSSFSKSEMTLWTPLCNFQLSYVKYCKFTTRPHSMSAIVMTKLHILSWNNHWKKMKIEVDLNDDVTGTKCLKCPSARKMSKTYHNTSQLNMEAFLPRLYKSGTSAEYHFQKFHLKESAWKFNTNGDTFTDFGQFKLHSENHRSYKIHNCYALFSSKSNINTVKARTMSVDSTGMFLRFITWWL
jgi:hypothetical protein